MSIIALVISFYPFLDKKEQFEMQKKNNPQMADIEPEPVVSALAESRKCISYEFLRQIDRFLLLSYLSKRKFKGSVTIFYVSVYGMFAKKPIRLRYIKTIY